jgi:hypothetical protein
MSEVVENGREVMTGRFAPGHSFSKGNPSNKRVAELRRTLLDCATPDRVKEVEQALFKAAVGGDVPAAKVWLEYTIGKPVQAVELSGPDGSSLDLTTVVQTVLVALGDDVSARLKVAQAFRRLGVASAPAPELDG